MAKTYIMKENSLHEQFSLSRNKIQFMGGGFGNGKTSAAVIKALSIAKDYPGANILMARSTYPKLNDTLRKTFIEFCPPEWIKSFATSKNSDNTCKLINGTSINFRYMAQRTSTEDGGSTSNLLSATYDLAVIDQIEDPEIVHKDFLDILGRLRGSAVYRGNDPTMPRTGPRWLILTSNPTNNWVYKRLIKPLHMYKKNGTITEDLICVRNNGEPVLKDGKPQVLIDLYEGSTYENAHVLEADFIETLEASYTGQMRERFLQGKWVAYEGLVYPDFDELTHVIRHDRLQLYIRNQIEAGVKFKFVEGYDFGIQKPSCYMLAIVDLFGNIFLVDGFYQPEASIEWQATKINGIRANWGVPTNRPIKADPSIFRRTSASAKTVGHSVAELFYQTDRTILLERGNNDIQNGIVKVRSYLAPQSYHQHPITREANSPYLYVSDNLSFFIEEIGSYYWDTNSKGDRDDEPVDRNDHAMDTLRYMLSEQPEVATLKRDPFKLPAHLTQWREKQDA